MIGTWTAPNAEGKTSEELLVSFDRKRSTRVLIIPALFDEANKLRRFTVEVMRRLDDAGIDAFLPDLPGMNESLAPLAAQTLASWREAASSAATTSDATHVLTVRAGALIAPAHIPGWQYAPLDGAKQLRAMIRARIIASREAGIEESSEQLLEQGRESGLALAGWDIGPKMINELETAVPTASENRETIAQSLVGGAGLWLRAEPGEDGAQSASLATAILEELGKPE